MREKIGCNYIYGEIGWWQVRFCITGGWMSAKNQSQFKGKACYYILMKIVKTSISLNYCAVWWFNNMSSQSVLKRQRRSISCLASFNIVIQNYTNTQKPKKPHYIHIDRFSDLLFCGQVNDTETRLECLLNNNKNSDFCAPLTSFDWNEVDPNLLGKRPHSGYLYMTKKSLSLNSCIMSNSIPIIFHCLCRHIQYWYHLHNLGSRDRTGTGKG